MSLVACAHCVDREREMHQQIRKAEKARATDRPAALERHLARVAVLKAELADCDHASMQRGKDATRARHAAARTSA